VLILIVTIIKTRDEFRDACAMNHLSAVNLATDWLGVSTHALLLRLPNHI